MAQWRVSNHFYLCLELLSPTLQECFVLCVLWYSLCHMLHFALVFYGCVNEALKMSAPVQHLLAHKHFQTSENIVRN